MTDEAPKGGDAKGKGKDDKVAVATSGAAIVMILLFVIWGFYFFKNITSGKQKVQLGGGFGDQLAPSSAVNAQRQLQNSNSSGPANADELLQIRANSAAGTSNTMDVQQTEAGSTPSPFGGSSGN